MKAIRTIGFLLVIVAALCGRVRLQGRKGGAASADKGGRKILYWVDPMHPAYKSDKPGIAPDCGMKLEPVYADGGAAAGSGGGREHVPATMRGRHGPDYPGEAATDRSEVRTSGSRRRLPDHPGGRQSGLSTRLASATCTRRWRAGSTRCSSTSRASWWRKASRC